MDKSSELAAQGNLKQKPHRPSKEQKRQRFHVALTKPDDKSREWLSWHEYGAIAKKKNRQTTNQISQSQNKTLHRRNNKEQRRRRRNPTRTRNGDARPAETWPEPDPSHRQPILPVARPARGCAVPRGGPPAGPVGGAVPDPGGPRSALRPLRRSLRELRGARIWGRPVLHLHGHREVRIRARAEARRRRCRRRRGREELAAEAPAQQLCGLLGDVGDDRGQEGHGSWQARRALEHWSEASQEVWLWMCVCVFVQCGSWMWISLLWLWTLRFCCWSCVWLLDQVKIVCEWD